MFIFVSKFLVDDLATRLGIFYFPGEFGRMAAQRGFLCLLLANWWHAHATKTFKIIYAFDYLINYFRYFQLLCLFLHVLYPFYYICSISE